jgi:flagellar protein FliL
MSTATAPETATAPPKKGKKKLLIMVGAAVLVLGLAGGGGLFYMKQKAAAEAAAADSEDGAAGHAKAAPKHDPKAVPTFVPLDPFTVNLADRESERFAQVGLSLQLNDAHAADKIKLYMPVIRNNILMVLSHKTSAELLERDGKTKLAADIQRETSRALGFEPPEDEADEEAEGETAEDKAKKKKKKKKPVAQGDPSPVTGVHFSNFIIQ